MRSRPLIASVLALTATAALAQTAYRYRDANGQWVYTDRAPASSQDAQTLALTHDKASPRIAVERIDDADGMQLLATNECLCSVTFLVAIQHSDFYAVASGNRFDATLGPNTRRPLVRIKGPDSKDLTLKFQWKALLGSPTAAHNPPRPYRVPVAVGTTYPISQAYPARMTHVTAESQYAVDIVVPDDTPIYAARDGVVINTRHDSFRGGIDPAMMDQANVVEILHDDGTIGIYGHLHWDSIRVRIGETVVRGQYIADSGSTGFSSGPHLHFAVLRNNGTDEVSVPVQFAGFAGSAVTPMTNQSITAY